MKKLMREKNEKSIFLMWAIACVLNPTLFTLYFFNLLFDYGEESRQLGMLVNAVDFAFFAPLLITALAAPNLIKMHITPLTYFTGFLLSFNTALWMTSTGGNESLVVSFVELIGISILVHGKPMHVWGYLACIAVSITALLSQTSYELSVILQPIIIVTLLCFVIVKFRYKMDEQHLDLIENKDQLAKACTELANAKKYIEQRQSEIVRQARSDSLMKLAGGMSHEINNPLAIIAGLSDSLVRKMDLGKLTADDIVISREKTQKLVKRVAGVVTSLRSFAGIAGIGTTKVIPLVEQIETLQRLLRYDKDRENVRIDIGIFDGIDQSNLLPIEILQILESLIRNGVCAAKESDKSWVRVNAYGQGDSMFFDVVDSGNGITSEVAEKIFDPFFTTKDVGKGMGLGLSEARGLVKKISGDLEFITDAENTTFRVTIRKFGAENKPGQDILKTPS